MLSEPVHSAVINQRLYVLDRGRSALYVLNRNGSLASETVRNEFRECSFILPFDCGIMVFSESGNVLMLTSELDYLKSVQLERSYSAGYVTDGRRILLVSRNDHGIYEYRCNLRKTGERWGDQLPK